MKELKSILAQHPARYPKMQPTDAVKLLYQNEFGGGHLIRDEEKCLTWLRKEYSETPQSETMPLMESIGNGIVRIHLAALDAQGYAIDRLGADFVRSARAQQGTLDSFLQKLELLRQMAKNGELPFSAEALEHYLEDYAKAGYPMVSHSDAYRAAYAPAYRVLRQEFLPKATE